MLSFAQYTTENDTPELGIAFESMAPDDEAKAITRGHRSGHENGSEGQFDTLDNQYTEQSLEQKISRVERMIENGQIVQAMKLAIKLLDNHPDMNPDLKRDLIDMAEDTLEQMKIHGVDGTNEYERALSAHKLSIKPALEAQNSGPQDDPFSPFKKNRELEPGLRLSLAA